MPIHVFEVGQLWDTGPPTLRTSHGGPYTMEAGRNQTFSVTEGTVRGKSVTRFESTFPPDNLQDFRNSFTFVGSGPTGWLARASEPTRSTRLAITSIGQVWSANLFSDRQPDQTLASLSGGDPDSMRLPIGLDCPNLSVLTRPFRMGILYAPN
ncbi:hypothetical protein PSTG_10204 [Puccinia striiformis f. sp. tritici PST-78]|uniref:Uncharacterized protein n=1 Tax=Puccinia striiformis f. sp. tritici PST-78 TaxID=1165861 RepID=A0A0L0VB40_9BASI|nr:hypothetical protein PSTG_10204 [Puccinia striiformis f. sp. tritici PST-78]